jgi:hypothetical protein
VKTAEFSDEFADRSKVRNGPEAAVGVQNLQTAAFDVRALLSGPSAIGQVLPKSSMSEMRQRLPIRAGWPLLESGHLVDQITGDFYLNFRYCKSTAKSKGVRIKGGFF